VGKSVGWCPIMGACGRPPSSSDFPPTNFTLPEVRG